MSRLNNDYSDVKDIKDIYDDKCLTHLNSLKLIGAGMENAKINFLLDMDRYTKYLFKYNNNSIYTALVIGCSIGYQVWALKERGFNSFGIDISQFAIDNAMPEIKDRCSVADIRRQPQLPKQQYDNVIAFDVLEHIPFTDLRYTIMNCRDLTKEIFIARIPTVYNNDYFVYDIEKIKSEHMITQRVEWWDEQLTKIFKPQEFNKLIEKQHGNDWWIYRFERIHNDNI